MKGEINQDGSGFRDWILLVQGLSALLSRISSSLIPKPRIEGRIWSIRRKCRYQTYFVIGPGLYSKFLLFIVIGDFELLDKFKVAETPPTRYGRMLPVLDENFNNSGKWIYVLFTSRKASLSALNPGKFRSLLYNKVQVQTVDLYILEVSDQLRFPHWSR
jgi:hypothetical protein